MRMHSAASVETKNLPESGTILGVTHCDQISLAI